MDDQAVFGPLVDRASFALHERQHAALRDDRLSGGAGGDVDGVPDPPGRQADLAAQAVGRGVPHQLGDVVHLAVQQPVDAAPRADVQGVADIQQPFVRRPHFRVRAVGEPGRRQGAEHDHVPQPAARLLEVRLQQVGGVAEGREPLVEGGQQFRQPLAGVVAPGGEQRGPGAGDQVGVTGDQPQVQQSDPGGELDPGDLGALGRRPYGMVQLGAAVPQRVPQFLGQGVDPPAVPAIVQQNQVDVGAGPEFPASEAADRSQRLALGAAGHLGPEGDQFGLDTIGHPTPTIRPGRGFPPGPDRDVETLGGQVTLQSASSPRSPVRTRTRSST